MGRITIFSLPTCPHCKRAKAVMKDLGEHIHHTGPNTGSQALHFHSLLHARMWVSHADARRVATSLSPYEGCLSDSDGVFRVVRMLAASFS